MLSVLQKLIEVQSSVVAACMGEQEMQWYQMIKVGCTQQVEGAR